MTVGNLGIIRAEASRISYSRSSLGARRKVGKTKFWLSRLPLDMQNSFVMQIRETLLDLLSRYPHELRFVAGSNFSPSDAGGYSWKNRRESFFSVFLFSTTVQNERVSSRASDFSDLIRCI